MSATGTSNAGASHRSQPQIFHNYYTSIYGGQGGSGGQGGEQGGGGGTGEGPVVHQHFLSSPVVQVSRLLNHCPPPSRIFHGRRFILDAMHQFFAQNTGKQKIYVLFGLGGAGKTQIALKFIEEWTSFTDRLFVDASTTETIEMGLKNIASTKQAGNSVQDSLLWLIDNQEKWLLFFDNADDPGINLNKFFPKCNHDNIIITSRNPNLRVYGAYSQVSDMDEDDAVELLLKSVQQEVLESKKSLALSIVKALWYLPLAIVQAAAFISESGTLDTYLDLFKKNQTEMLNKKSDQSHDDYAWPIYIWEMSFRKLSQPAATLLQLCSFLHRDDIFEEIFSRAANSLSERSNQSKSKPGRLRKLRANVKRVVSRSRSHYENSSKAENEKAKEFLSYFVGPSGEWDSFRFLTVTNEIKAYSLISFDLEKKSFSIHPLVHSWSRTTLGNPEPYHSCMDNILGASIAEIPDQDLQLASLRLISHIDSIISKSTHFGWEYAILYHYVGRNTEAKELAVREVEKQRNLLGDDHLDTLGAKHNLANIYIKMGRFKEAEKLQVMVLKKQRKLLGDDDLFTLHTMDSLILTYREMGRFKEAEQLQVVVLEKQKKLFGDDISNTLSTRHSLANTYNSLGRFEEAEKLQVVVVEKWKKALGDDHLNTLNAMHNLALTYYGLGRFEEAEQFEVVVLEKRRKLLGDDNLDTLSSMYTLANIYYCLDRFKEAEMLHVVVLEKRRKLLGVDHPNTLCVMNNLGRTHYCQGQFVKGEELQVIVLEKRRRLLGDEHPHTRLAMRNLPQTYHSLGKETEAAEVKNLLRNQ
ncbi:P-loop containing nucleoside triphosphate hydrolase protein [Mycena sanguinolenta]|nr:P-loop containing nucleoside triphosphate hydrolase protein [Mycena sanguinolenta]